MAADRDACRHSVYKAANEFGKDRKNTQKVQRCEGRLEAPQRLDRSLLSYMDTAHDPVIFAFDSLVISVSVDEFGRLDLLR